MVRAGPRLERSMIRCGCCSLWSNSIRPDQGLDGRRCDQRLRKPTLGIRNGGLHLFVQSPEGRATSAQRIRTLGLPLRNSEVESLLRLRVRGSQPS